MGVVLARVTEDVALEVSDEAVVVVDELDIDLYAVTDDRIGELLGQSDAVDLVSDLPAELGQVALAVGVLDVAGEITPFADEVGPPAHEASGGPHPLGVDVGEGKGAAAEQGGDLAGVDPVVLGLPSVDGLDRVRVRRAGYDGRSSPPLG